MDQHGRHATEGAACCAHEPGRAPAWYKQPKQWALRVVLPLLALGLVWPPLQPVTRVFLDYLWKTWWALGLGLLFGGLIDHFVPQTYIAKFFSRARGSTVAMAVGLGLLFSGCSHGCLALSMALYKKGASSASVISFLLASPWASLSLSLVILSLFGVKGAWVIASALLVAMTTGLMFLQLERRGWIERNPHTVELPEGFSVAADITRRAAAYRPTAAQLRGDARGVGRGTVMLADMVVWWLVIGFYLAGMMGSLLPHEAFMRWFGPSVTGLLATMGAAMLIEACSEGSAPLAFELFKHTGALGNSFAFLMGGVVTDVTELGLVWSTIGKRTAFWMVVLTLPQVLLLGLLLNR